MWEPEDGRGVSGEVVLRAGKTDDAGVAGEIAVLAWRSIYETRRELVGSEIFEHFWGGWSQRKRRSVEEHIRTSPGTSIISTIDGTVVGFLTYIVKRDAGHGVIGNNAVHPDFTGRGIGTAQCREALDTFKRRGLRYASVMTGLDLAHAPARRMYEKVGFARAVPQTTYYQILPRKGEGGKDRERDER